MYNPNVTGFIFSLRYIYIYIYIYIYEGVHGVIYTVVGDRHGDTNTNPRRHCLHFTQH